MTRRPVVLAAGGTGGHVFPAEALAGELRVRGHGLVLITDVRGFAFGGVLGDIPVHTIPAGTILTGGPAQRFAGLRDAVAGTFRARGLLARIHPSVVVGFGGYPSLPTMAAAVWRKIPTVLHEQNAVLGRVNRLLAPHVQALALSFPATDRLRPADQPKAEIVGNPVRRDVLTARDAPYVAPGAVGAVSVLVLGGSQGASVLSEVVPRAMALLAPDLRARLKVSQQSRPGDLDAARERYAAAEVWCELAPFFDDVPQRLAGAHLVICRAGASTVAEVAAAGRPAILVPYPFAADDHQTANARVLVDAGGGWMIPQPVLTPESLARLLAQVLSSDGGLGEAASRSRSQGRPEAARALAQLTERLAYPRGALRSVRIHGAIPSGGAEHGEAVE